MPGAAEPFYGALGAGPSENLKPAPPQLKFRFLTNHSPRKWTPVDFDPPFSDNAEIGPKRAINNHLIPIIDDSKAALARALSYMWINYSYNITRGMQSSARGRARANSGGPTIYRFSTSCDPYSTTRQFTTLSILQTSHMSFLQLPGPGGGRLNRFRPQGVAVWSGFVKRVLARGCGFGKRVWGYWLALEGVALGFFVAAAVALITHKCTLIALHQPLPVLWVICFAPVIFMLDALTLIILHEGLSTTSSLPWRISSMVVSTVIASCSATFVSLYLEAKAELDWERALEVKLKHTSLMVDRNKLESIQ